MITNDNKCVFCREFNGRQSAKYFKSILGADYDIDNRCILETENFLCVPSVGSFVEGYVLVSPKQHYLSTLMLPECYLDELLSIIRALSDFYSNYYHQKFLIYEHGTANTRNVGGMSIAHAHLHFVPCSQQMIHMFPEFNFLRFDTISEVRKYYLKNSKKPYLLLKDIDGAIYIAVDNNIPSQFFRKRVCDICGIKNTGDWRDYPYTDNIKKTLSAAKQYGVHKLQCKG